MEVEVLFFAQLREIAGVRQKTFSLPEGARLNDLLEMLTAVYGPDFRQEVETLEGMRVIIGDREYGISDGLAAPLRNGDTVAFIPPIAGG